MLTPYQFASNRPIDGSDLDGLEYTPKGKYGQYGEIIVDNVAAQSYRNTISVIKKEEVDAQAYQRNLLALQNQARVVSQKEADFQRYLSDPDNIGGQTAYQIYRDVQNAKASYKEGEWVSGTMHALSAGINTATLVGAGNALGVKSGTGVKTEPFVYRFDTRSLKEIYKAGGFKSWGIDMDVMEHASGNSIANQNSGFVSTTFSLKAAKQMAAGREGNIFTLKVGGLNGVDVNKTLGTGSPFPHEQEYAVPLHIPVENIINVKSIPEKH